MKEDKQIWNSENPFKVPEGYFQEFDNRLMREIDGDNLKERTPVKKLSLIAPWVGLAAAFLIIALIYQQLPERVYPDRFRQTEMMDGTMLYYDVSPADFFGEYELLEYISETEETDIDIFPDSLFFSAIDEDDLIMLTLFH